MVTFIAPSVSFCRDEWGSRAIYRGFTLGGARHFGGDAKLGLSMALGTFLAGVLLAESEYRHELEIAIEPFKGLLLGLFLSRLAWR